MSSALLVVFLRQVWYISPRCKIQWQISGIH
ncbi:hypothetical protein Godav_005705 [Gossypium davidsonii]|uniref:Uncharacterized protein n=1 Tax=Gossypium davidsonii TaxID=34287 RepID=A0A7J8S1D9_GOSDV|nr:hypothetical protein [Gossypium davidsonii]